MKRNKSHKHTIIISIIIFVLAAVLTVTAVFTIWLYNKYYKIDFYSTDFTETNELLDNPYMGWYKIYGYSLSDQNNYTQKSILEECSKDTNTRLALLQINLKDYRNSQISEYGLLQLQTIFEAFISTDKSLIVRFVYDWNGKAISSEPDDLNTILTHMEQVGTIVNQYSNNIYTMQGLFVGNYGEMNGSNYLSLENMQTLADKLSSVIDSSIPLAVRTPAQLRTITAQNTGLASRFGLYNDGMLGSESDYGTYGNISLINSTSPSDKLTRADELAFQYELCNKFPNGGEVINDNPYNDFDNACIDLATMHVSYLNYQYDDKVLNKWKASIYTGNDVYNGLNGYDYITAHMGYRYVLSSALLEFNTFKDQTATLKLNIKNVGFSSSYHNFEITAYVTNTDTQATYKIPIYANTSQWYSNTTAQLNIPLDIRSYQNGNYQIGLAITDNNNLIYMANNNLGSDNLYSLGSFTVSK